MKKIISILISCFMIFSAFSVSYAQEAENYGYIPYERADSEYFISPENEIQTLSLEEELPTSYDSRDYGFVSPVKNQGSGNTCWAFAAIGALESYMLKNYGEKDENGKVIDTNEFDFSENHMQYMMSSWNNNPLGFEVPPGETRYDESNNKIPAGGNSLFSSSYFLSDFGPVFEADDPYTNINYRDYSATKDLPKGKYRVDSVEFVPSISVPTETDYSNFSAYYGKLQELETTLADYKTQLDSYTTVPVEGEENYEEYTALKNTYNETVTEFNNYVTAYNSLVQKINQYRYYLKHIKELIRDYGSVVCGVNYSSSYMTADKRNLYSTALEVNHQISIVGWDDTYSKSNFKNTPVADGAFIAKNSWGTEKNDNGYFYLSYCDYNLFMDLMAITSVTERNEKEVLYNLDPYGNAGIVLADSEAVGVPVKYGNSFVKKTENEKLTGVSLYVYGGLTYNISLIDSQNLDESLAVSLFDESFQPNFNGYYTLRLDNPIPVTSDNFEIIVTASYDGNAVVIAPVESNAYATAKVNGVETEIPIISKVTSENFESFIKFGDGQWLNTYSEDYGNFCIKAITETTDSYSEFEFANFTDEKGVEKTNFTAGEAVYIVPALNGANLDGKQIICVGYDGNKAVKMLQYKNFTSDEQNRFKIENIPSDFEYYTFYMYVWEMSGLKPLGEAIKVGTEK